MEIKNRQQWLAIAAVAAIVILAGERLILSPLLANWKARSERIASLRKSIEQGSMLVDREAALRARWKEMGEHTLPSNASAAENTVLKAFDRWSRDSRISVTSLKPQWRSSEEAYVTLECRADASGSLGAITRFLHEMEKDPLALRVESVEITARDADARQLAIAVQVSGLLLEPESE